jgi:hypothetical protein
MRAVVVVDGEVYRDMLRGRGNAFHGMSVIGGHPAPLARPALPSESTKYRDRDNNAQAVDVLDCGVV